MILSDNPNQILNRIETGQHTQADLEMLCQLLQTSNQKLLLQLGKYNVNIGEGKDIHIGDRIYLEWTEEAIEALVKALRSSPIGLPQNIPHRGVINFVGRADKLQLYTKSCKKKTV